VEALLDYLKETLDPVAERLQAVINTPGRESEEEEEEEEEEGGGEGGGRREEEEEEEKEEGGGRKGQDIRRCSC